MTLNTFTLASLRFAILALVFSACGQNQVYNRSSGVSGSGDGRNGGGEPLEEGDGSAVPQFGKPGKRKFKVIGTAADGLANPRDLEFNPEVPGELWTVNQDSEGVVIYHNAGTSSQRAESLHDSHAMHFMSQVSSIAFGVKKAFATCQESRNEARGIIDFMGPTLWPSDLDIFAAVNQNGDGGECDGSSNSGTLLGSHIDMLHQSPLCMGIAHVKENQYWVFDGDHGDLVYYDFVKDHGPGYDDHSDGRLRRFSNVKLNRVVGVPGHMIVDKTTDLLYIADTGSGSILKVDASAAKSVGNISPEREPLAKYNRYSGEVVSTFADGLRQPSGIAITGRTLFVSDHSTGEIIAYNLDTQKEIERIQTDAKNIMGLEIDANKHLWYVDGGANQVIRIDP